MANLGMKTRGCSVYRSLDLDEGTAEVVVARPAVLCALWVTNKATSVRYIKLYDRLTATAGTHTPVVTIGIPGNTTDNVLAVMGVGGGLGIYFDTGICMAATTGLADNDTGAPGTNDLIVNAFYQG